MKNTVMLEALLGEAHDSFEEGDDLKEDRDEERDWEVRLGQNRMTVVNEPRGHLSDESVD